MYMDLFLGEPHVAMLRSSLWLYAQRSDINIFMYVIYLYSHIDLLSSGRWGLFYAQGCDLTSAIPTNYYIVMPSL